MLKARSVSVYLYALNFHSIKRWVCTLPPRNCPIAPSSFSLISSHCPFLIPEIISLPLLPHPQIRASF